MDSDQPATIRSSAWRFLSGTFLSRVSGLLREIVTAAFFGASASVAAFFVAYRMAYLLRRLLGEGAMQAGFAPSFEASRKEKTTGEVQFFRDLLFSLALVLLAVVILVEGGCFCWLYLGTPSASIREILMLSMVMFPGVIFICLYALFSALLQCEGKFFLPSFAPVLFNLVLIAALFAVRDFAQDIGVYYLSLAVVVACAMQWVVLIPAVWRWWKSYQMQSRLQDIQLFSPALRLMIKAMSFSLIGIGAVQINSAMDIIFARYAALSGPAFLSYAMRLYQLPLSLFGLALSSALLPPLARAAQNQALERLRGFIQYALSRSIGLMIPCTCAIFALGLVSINTIFGRGCFDKEAVIASTTALWLYGLGLAPAVFVLILSAAFYAQKDFVTPLKASLYSVVCNLLLNSFFVFFLGWQHNSIALATSIAALLNASLLLRALQIQVGSIIDIGIAMQWAKTTAAALLACILTLIIGSTWLHDGSLSLLLGYAFEMELPHAVFAQVMQLAALGALYGFILVIAAWFLRAEDILKLIKIRANQSL